MSSKKAKKADEVKEIQDESLLRNDVAKIQRQGKDGQDSADSAAKKKKNAGKGLCFGKFYDPYSSSLTDHYVLGSILGRGAYGEVRSAKLRAKSQFFSNHCFRCYFGVRKKNVDAIVGAPDLDDVIEAFKHK